MKARQHRAEPGFLLHDSEPQHNKSRMRGPWKGVHAALVIALIGGFVALGTGPLLHALVLPWLPSQAEPVTITGRDFTDSPGGVLLRGKINGSRHNFILLKDVDGLEHKIACPLALYDAALLGLRRTDSVTLERSILLGSPTRLILVTRSLIDLPLAAPIAPSEEQFSLLMPPAGAWVGFVFCFGLAGWMLWKLPQKQSFPWAVFFLAMALCAALGTWWWL